MYKTGGDIMINFKQHMENIHPCLLEHFEYLEGLIGQRSLARVGTLNAQSEDNVYTGEMYPFLDDESSKYALIIIDGKCAEFIKFITGTHTFYNVKIVWSNNTLTIGFNPNTILQDEYTAVIIGDWTDEGLGRFYEEYCKLYNKIYSRYRTSFLRVGSWTDIVTRQYGGDFINHILSDDAKLILQNASKKYVINLLDGASIYDNKYELTAPIGNLGYNIVITCNDTTSTNAIYTIKYVEQ